MTAQTLASSPHNASPFEAGLWRQEMSHAFRQGADLLAFLGLDAKSASATAAASFPCMVPPAFAARMRHADLSDPLLRQVLPIDSENQLVPGFVADPLAEADAHCAPGLLQKYTNRALLVCTGACAIHCRYCFRRHFDYQQTPTGNQWWSEALAHIRADENIDEVILSGGDPLLLPDNQIFALLAELETIPHVKRLRMHTRIPIVLPSRVDVSFMQGIEMLRLPLVMVVHANHAQEFDADVQRACQVLRAAGVHLLNQSVLLRDVNDSVVALADLSHALFAAGVMPYYLHCLDPVAGTAHFHVDDEWACALMRRLQAQLPGYLVPRLAREVPGTASKQLIPF